MQRRACQRACWQLPLVVKLTLAYDAHQPYRHHSSPGHVSHFDSTFSCTSAALSSCINIHTNTTPTTDPCSLCIMASEKSAEHAHIEKLIANNLPGSPIYAFLLTPVRVVSASKGHVLCRLPLTQNHMNSKGGIHGSVSATIVDWMGGMAIASWDLREKTGVSVDIHVTYQSSAKEGDEIEIEGIADKVGGSLAFTKVNIFKVQDGQRGAAVITGTHTKFVRA